MGSNHNADDGDGHVLRRLKTAVVLCLCFFFVEVAGGLISGSLAILSDAAHLFADLASFAVAIAAAYLSKLPPSSVCTYGYKRTEALAALFSMSCLLVMSLFLAGEAVHRMYLIKFDWENYEHVDGKFMSLVAAIGVIVNITLAFVLGEHHVHLPGDDHDHSHEHAHGHDHHDDDDHDHDHHNHNHHDDDDDDKHHDHEHGHLHGPNKKHTSATTNGHSHEHGHSNHESDDNHDSDSDSHEHKHEHDHDHGHAHNDHNDHEHEHDHEHNDHHNHDEHEHAHEGTKLLGGNGNDIEKGHHHHLDHFDSSDDNNSSTNNDKFHKERNINLHAAYLHVLGDLTQSVAVLIAGCLIWYNSQWQIADPICTILFCFIVAYSTVGVIKSSVQVLLNNVPPNVELNKLYNAISAVHGISNVHDLHVWSISHGAPAVSLHANCSTKVAIPKALSDVNKVCEQFNIRHTTIQLQPSDHIHESCITCSDDDESNNMNHGHNVSSSDDSNNGNGGNGNGNGRNSVHCSSFNS